MDYDLYTIRVIDIWSGLRREHPFYKFISPWTKDEDDMGCIYYTDTSKIPEPEEVSKLIKNQFSHIIGADECPVSLPNLTVHVRKIKAMEKVSSTVPMFGGQSMNSTCYLIYQYDKKKEKYRLTCLDVDNIRSDNFYSHITSIKSLR